MKHDKRTTLPPWRMAIVLSLALGAPAWANEAGDKFQKMDTNNDGMVSAAEHGAGATRMFGEMDANGDGNVTAMEMDARHGKKMAAQSGEPVTYNDADQGDMHRPMMSSADMIGKMDTNNDGMMSAAEHDAHARTMFSDADSDGNGSLSQQEMNAAHATMMKRKHDTLPPKTP